MQLSGSSFIGYKRISPRDSLLYSFNPATNERLEPGYAALSSADVDTACELAHQAFLGYRHYSAEKKAEFLENIATHLNSVAAEIVDRAMQETGLPQARLQGELGRTTSQLKLFANNLRNGITTERRFDAALPDRTPLPRPDLRLSFVPLGPVAVFGASNFPLAFSVAGGDTASALAAGCPVIFKAHSAHLGTSEIVAQAISTAAQECAMPEGIFSVLFGAGNEVGQALASHPRVAAIGFTGSRQGGLSLLRTAQGRPVPIPVYAEMSSVNPVCLMPAALAEDTESIAINFCASLLMGAGQFCTNPGLVFALAGESLDKFTQIVAKTLTNADPAVMLTAGIHKAYRSSVKSLSQAAGVEVLFTSAEPTDPNRCTPQLFKTTAQCFLTQPELHQEVFGSSALVVACETQEELLSCLQGLEGQLTGTVIGSADSDTAFTRAVLQELELKVGRVLFNGYPTGVEVCHSMVHGGPYPATSAPATTSVGSKAIERFLRPVCYQNIPQTHLPQDLRDDSGAPGQRLLNGEWINT